MTGTGLEEAKKRNQNIIIAIIDLIAGTGITECTFGFGLTGTRIITLRFGSGGPEYFLTGILPEPEV